MLEVLYKLLSQLSCRAIFLDLGARKADGLRRKKKTALERQGPLFSKLDRCTGQAFCDAEDTQIPFKPRQILCKMHV